MLPSSALRSHTRSPPGAVLRRSGNGGMTEQHGAGRTRTASARRDLGTFGWCQGLRPPRGNAAVPSAMPLRPNRRWQSIAGTSLAKAADALRWPGGLMANPPSEAFVQRQQ